MADSGNDRYRLRPRSSMAPPRGSAPQGITDPATGWGRPWMTDLVARMEQELRLRGYSHRTRKLYLGHVRRFLSVCPRDPGSRSEELIRRYVLGLL